MAPQSTKSKIVHVHLPEGEHLATTLTAGRHDLRADEPEGVEGGRDKGPDPYDYLLMSLGSCTVITVKMYAQRKGWDVKNIFMELHHNKRHAEDCENCDSSKSKIDVIEKELIIEGDLSQEQRDRLLEISKRCPVHRTLLNDIKIYSSISKK